MRARGQTHGLSVRAIAGNHAVFLGFDLQDEQRPGCLGFALYRVDHTEGEEYWLSGFKTFRSVVPLPLLTAVYPSNEQPVQNMWWGDYTAKPAHDYTYRVVPVYGTPTALDLRDDHAVSLDLTTSDPTIGEHGVYFNRGVAASQAYAAKFGKSPDKLPPERRAEAMTWLSRGLHEAMLDFIANSVDENVVLRAAVYEFTEPTVLAAFAQARTAGADVHIVYHATGDQGRLNDAAIAAQQLDPTILTRRTHAPIAHNKFIVRGNKNPDGSTSADEVWTGSTNFSEGGIFGHSNVAHVVRDTATAAAYLDYWDQLHADPIGAELRKWVDVNNPFIDPAQGPAVRSAFSPRRGLAPLEWYAQQFALAPHCAHITLPFGMDNAHFEPLLDEIPAGSLHFVMLNKRDDHQDIWSTDRDIQIAVGATADPDALSRWAPEHLTGFNPLVKYLHTKVLLRDVLTDAPTVISGSANFSAASTTANDENMLIIHGDTDVADVYFTEYTRIFEHFYARYWAAQMHAGVAPDRSFLSEDDSWQQRFWNANSPKSKERLLYQS